MLVEMLEHLAVARADERGPGAASSAPPTRWASRPAPTSRRSSTTRARSGACSSSPTSTTRSSPSPSRRSRSATATSSAAAPRSRSPATCGSAAPTCGCASPARRSGVPVGPARLVTLCGLAAAKYLLLSSRTVGADEALRLGLVNRVAPAAGTEESALHSPPRSPPIPPEAVARLKRMLHEWDDVEGRSRVEGVGQVELAAHGPGLPGDRALAISANQESLTVAVTGPTGRSASPSSPRSRARPGGGAGDRDGSRARSTPPPHGWEKVEYRRGDILDRDLGRVAGRGGRRRRPPRLRDRRRPGGESREINLTGLAQRLRGRPLPPVPGAWSTPPRSPPTAFTAICPSCSPRTCPVRGWYRAIRTRPTRPRSRQSARRGRWPARTPTAYVFRPCIVAGPEATLLFDLIPLLALGQKIPGPLRWALGRAPRAAPGTAGPRGAVPAGPPGRRRRGALRRP